MKYSKAHSVRQGEGFVLLCPMWVAQFSRPNSALPCIGHSHIILLCFSERKIKAPFRKSSVGTTFWNVRSTHQSNPSARRASMQQSRINYRCHGRASLLVSYTFVFCRPNYPGFLADPRVKSTAVSPRRRPVDLSELSIGQGRAEIEPQLAYVPELK